MAAKFGASEAIIKSIEFNWSSSNIKKMKNSTPNVMLYRKTSVMPISVDIKTRVISYWSKLIASTNRKLSTDEIIFNYNNTLNKYFKK